MLKKVNRLVKAKDIQTTFVRGRTFFSPFFTIKFHAGSPPLKFTVVVSTKVFKKANKRNRLKRLIRESMKKNLNSLKHGNYMVIAKPKIATIPEEKWVIEFDSLLRKVK